MRIHIIRKQFREKIEHVPDPELHNLLKIVDVTEAKVQSIRDKITSIDTVFGPSKKTEAMALIRWHNVKLYELWSKQLEEARNEVHYFVLQHNYLF